MPGENSYAFIVPTSAQMDTFRSVIDAILNEQYFWADSLAAYIGYILYEWYDTSKDSNLYYVLMELQANQIGGVKSGWGTYIFYPEGQPQVIIEVPHPYFDSNTWRVGFAAYQQLNSRVFVMAGTHRYANGRDPRPADMAHTTQSMFHVVHQQVAPLNNHSLQVHGFIRNLHPGYPDVVLSNGTASPSTILDTLALSISDQTYSVGIFDGINFSDLGATTNTQGQWSNDNGYSFIHMELENFIRNSQSEWKKILNALYNVFFLPFGIEFTYREKIIHQVLLYPNYPNPFNHSTEISFSIASPQQVRMDIYDLHGKKIFTIINNHLSSGTYRLSWDGRNGNGVPVASGAYILVLQSENGQKQTKIHLVK
jgi:hypothetical protein